MKRILLFLILLNVSCAELAQVSAPGSFQPGSSEPPKPIDPLNECLSSRLGESIANIHHHELIARVAETLHVCESGVLDVLSYVENQKGRGNQVVQGGYSE